MLVSKIPTFRSVPIQYPHISRISSWWFGTSLIFPYIGESHHPNWRTRIFFRGVAKNHQPDGHWIEMIQIHSPYGAILAAGQSTSVISRNHKQHPNLQCFRGENLHNFHQFPPSNASTSDVFLVKSFVKQRAEDAPIPPDAGDVSALAVAPAAAAAAEVAEVAEVAVAAVPATDNGEEERLLGVSRPGGWWNGVVMSSWY